MHVHELFALPSKFSLCRVCTARLGCKIRCPMSCSDHFRPREVIVRPMRASSSRWQPLQLHKYTRLTERPRSTRPKGALRRPPRSPSGPARRTRPTDPSPNPPPRAARPPTSGRAAGTAPAGPEHMSEGRGVTRIAGVRTQKGAHVRGGPTDRQYPRWKTELGRVTVANSQ
jgi:hypothetical protein